MSLSPVRCSNSLSGSDRASSRRRCCRQAAAAGAGHDPAARPLDGPVRMTVDRHYQLPPRTIWVLRGFIAMCETFGVIAVLDNQGGTFGIVVGLVCCVGLVAIWIRAEASWPKVGLYETSDGLRAVGLSVVGGLRTLRRFSWEHIDRFEISRASKRRVMVVLRGGRATWLLGTKQGVRISWGDGETTDIAEVLNQRLNDRRASSSQG